MSAESVNFHEWCQAKVRSMMPEQHQCSMELAARDFHCAVADFFIAIQLAQTNADALRIYEMISPLVILVEAAESAALNRADELTGKGR